jgi:hypothetical protein
MSQRLLIAIGGAMAAGALLMGPSAGVAGAAPGDCFGIPDCDILPGLLEPTGKGGGGYANGTAGGGYATGDAGGAFSRDAAGGGYATGSAGGAASRGQAGGAFNHTE